ncbi:response regulator [Lyngbya aestuarii]|uniref:response regulator n=1 Tax=Lyngbya aestuarii TaxID=118322 RepID=UPI00403E1B33
MANQDLSNFSMRDLFRMEVETQAAVLNEKLLALEAKLNQTEGAAPESSLVLEYLMRAAHSIKGAARIVQVEPAVKVAHAMEDWFVAAQQEEITLSANQIDLLLQGVDLLLRLAQFPETDSEKWLSQHNTEVENLVGAISATLVADNHPAVEPVVREANLESNQSFSEEIGQAYIVKNPGATTESIEEPEKTDSALELSSSPSVPRKPPQVTQETDRRVRVSAANLNCLMGLAGESLVEANWLLPFADSLNALRRRQRELSQDLENLLTSNRHVDQRLEAQLELTRQKADQCYQILVERLSQLEVFARRSAEISDRLYRQVIATQMRPLADGVEGFPRMVRDLAKELDKQIRFEIIGKSTQVDRDILEKLEAPLTHLLRNAVDHGIESPQERLRLGKPAVGNLRIEATHQAGMLLITVADDGRGVDIEQLRRHVISKGMVGVSIAERLTETELIEFLFLPGFSTSNHVTEISGRGVGLDIVRSMVESVGGLLRAVAQPLGGMTFHLQLPLTLSVIRALLVEISGEAYAFALSRIDRVLMIPKAEIAVSENRQFLRLDEQNIGLVAAHQLLELPPSTSELAVLPVVVVSDSPKGTTLNSDRYRRYGVVVERFLEVRDLVVRPLDPRLGKVRDISAAAMREDGSIILIVDVEDLVRSIDRLLAGEQLSTVTQAGAVSLAQQSPHILVVDDSLTVREVERKLLENQGYKVEVAVNGIEAWNAIRTGNYDLVITDVDMPRMNGIELVSQIRQHSFLNSLPVIIVSYKDREEDYIQGLDVGANYYLTKSSFQDDTFLEAVIDLVGEA